VWYSMLQASMAQVGQPALQTSSTCTEHCFIRTATFHHQDMSWRSCDILGQFSSICGHGQLLAERMLLRRSQAMASCYVPPGE
jgi:hypothetical protein